MRIAKRCGTAIGASQQLAFETGLHRLMAVAVSLLVGFPKKATESAQSRLSRLKLYDLVLAG